MSKDYMDEHFPAAEETDVDVGHGPCRGEINSWLSETSPSVSEAIKITPGDTLHGNDALYHVVRVLGEGAFGEVLECHINDTEDKVAVKVLKDPEAIFDAENEIKMLQMIAELDPEGRNTVKLMERFDHRGHTCLVFEMLDISLWDLVDTDGTLSILEVRRVAQQLLLALDSLKNLSIIHSDLKPDNVMLTNRELKPYHVKLIDFGLAWPTSAIQQGEVVQPQEFRAMEVSLGCEYECPIDMWGLGCVLVFLLTGEHLFSDCDYQAMKMRVDLLGMPPESMIVSGCYSETYFKNDSQDKARPRWTLCSPEEYTQHTGLSPGQPSVLQEQMETLDDLIKMMPVDKVESQKDTLAFMDFLKGLLAVDPRLRLTPKQALEHPFITMTHLSDDSSHLSEALKEMQMNNPRESVAEEETQPTPINAAPVEDLPINIVLSTDPEDRLQDKSQHCMDPNSSSHQTEPVDSPASLSPSRDADLDVCFGQGQLAGLFRDVADSLVVTTKPKPCETIPIFHPELRTMAAAAEISAGCGCYVPLAVDLTKSLCSLAGLFTNNISTWFRRST